MISYTFEGDKDTLYIRATLTNDNGLSFYSTRYIDTIIKSGFSQGKINLKNTKWLVNDDTIPFYDFENKTYDLQFWLDDFYNANNVASNTLTTTINNPNPDTSILNNFILTDINNSQYELIEVLNQSDFLFIFEFASWCGWSRISFPLVNDIDSMFNGKVQVFGIEGSPHENVDQIDLSSLVESKNIEYPVFIRVNNSILNNILHPDGYLAYPIFLIINNKRRIIFRQNGYSENLIDSVKKHLD